MKYRRFGKTGWDSSVIGFRVMALPGFIAGNTDEEKTINIIRYAVEKGINYIDTGVPHFPETQEKFAALTGKALSGGFREKVKIAATLPSLHVENGDDFNRYLDNQLRLLDEDSIDFYSVGFLNRSSWARLKEIKITDYVEKALSDSRIKYAGFYMHDDFQVLRDIISGYDNWTFARFSYSYMDVDHHPGTGGIRFASEKGLAVVVSDPLRNGRLIRNIPDQVSGIWDTASVKRNPVERGLGWAWNLKEVSTVLSDMADISEIDENSGYAEEAEPESVSLMEEIIMGRARNCYQDMRPIKCTACRCCMPCSVNIDVPRIFEIYNDAVIYNDIHTGGYLYAGEMHNTEACIGCGQCISACPREIPINEWLDKAVELLKDL